MAELRTLEQVLDEIKRLEARRTELQAQCQQECQQITARLKTLRGLRKRIDGIAEDYAALDNGTNEQGE